MPTKQFHNTFSVPVIPVNEAARLQALYGYGILEADVEKSFDNIATLVASAFDVPIALISFVDAPSVTDNGIGFDPQYQVKVFDIFKRLHDKKIYPGTGIGLAICRKIAEVHQGAIFAESQVGEGATFTVFMPDDL